MIAKKVLERRQQQANDLLAKHADELRRLEQRHAEARRHMAELQASETAVVKERHRKDFVDLYQAQGRELGPWATSVLEGKAVARDA